MGTAENFVRDLKLQEHSVDLISVAQALHWLDVPAFYAQCRKALKHNGIMAAFGYGVAHFPDHPEASRIMKVTCLVR